MNLAMTGLMFLAIDTVVVEIGVGGMDRRTHPGKEDKPIGALGGLGFGYSNEATCV